MRTVSLAGSGPTETSTDAGELHRLEAALANRDAGAVSGGLAALIPDDFLEFGASGRQWTSVEVRAMLEAGPDALPPLPLEDFAVAQLAPDLVLVTYRLAGERPSLRSSIWVRRDGRWVMRFHQGTLAPV